MEGVWSQARTRTVRRRLVTVGRAGSRSVGARCRTIFRCAPTTGARSRDDRQDDQAEGDPRHEPESSSQAAPNRRNGPSRSRRVPNKRVRWCPGTVETTHRVRDAIRRVARDVRHELNLHPTLEVDAEEMAQRGLAVTSLVSPSVSARSRRVRASSASGRSRDHDMIPFASSIATVRVRDAAGPITV